MLFDTDSLYIFSSSNTREEAAAATTLAAAICAANAVANSAALFGLR